MYDLLLHHDLDWPSLCVAWGSLEGKDTKMADSDGNDSNGLSLEIQRSSLEMEKEKYHSLQRFYFSSRTDGYYDLWVQVEWPSTHVVWREGRTQ